MGSATITRNKPHHGSGPSVMKALEFVPSNYLPAHKEKSMSSLSNQEALFLDRIALYLAAAGGEVALPLIEQAAKKVLEDDTRILNTLSKNDELRTEAVTHLSGRAYDRLMEKQAAHFYIANTSM